MKRGVSKHWNPITEYRRRDPTGNIYGHRSRVTVLTVRLDIEGNLTEVDVTTSSGIDFLDREAVSAFRRAQPFPNPPSGLIENEQIEFPFGFHVDFSRRGLRLPF
jgi:TonB family protein